MTGGCRSSCTSTACSRPLGAAELSDGTLRYLLWIAALLSPRPADLLVLNEPETSLHPDLLLPLGELISAAAGRTQVIAVTHSASLIDAVRRASHQAGPGTDRDRADEGLGRDQGRRPRAA